MRFILVDRILRLEPGRRIEAHKRLEAGEELFRDHFPGFPVVPGVLLTEMMAQAAGKCLDAEGRPRGKAMLAQILKASFREWMAPDETAHIAAEIKLNRERYATAECAVAVDGRTIATAELFFSFLPWSRLAPGYRDEILEAFREGRDPATGGGGPAC